MAGRCDTPPQFRIGHVSPNLRNQLIGRAEEGRFLVLPVKREEFLGSRGEHERANRRYLEAAPSVVVAVTFGKKDKCDTSGGDGASVVIAPNVRDWKPIAPTMAGCMFLPRSSEQAKPNAGVDEPVYKLQAIVWLAMPNKHDICFEALSVSLGEGDRSMYRRLEVRWE
jgi:hypothetical protein